MYAGVGSGPPGRLAFDGVDSLDKADGRLFGAGQVPAVEEILVTPSPSRSGVKPMVFQSRPSFNFDSTERGQSATCKNSITAVTGFWLFGAWSNPSTPSTVMPWSGG